MKFGIHLTIIVFIASCGAMNRKSNDRNDSNQKNSDSDATVDPQIEAEARNCQMLCFT